MPIEITVEPCILVSFSLDPSVTEIDFILGSSEDIIVPVTAVQSPACFQNPRLKDVTIALSPEIETTPLDLEIESFVIWDDKEESLVILATDNLQLLNSTLSLQVHAQIEGSPLVSSLDITVNYITEGPSFKTNIIAPAITCSKEDLKWNVTLPELVAADQQNIFLELQQLDEFNKLFVLNDRTVTIADEYINAVSQGKLCPNSTSYNQSIKVTSNILGSRVISYTVPVEHPEDPDQEIFYFDFLTSLLSQYTG